MTFESAIAFVGALLLWVLIPGPAIFAIIGRALTKGFASALKLIAGILLGDMFYIAIALFGMAAIGKSLGNVFVLIKMLGASYLIFLGVRLWFGDSKWNNVGPTDTQPDRYTSFLAGFSITLGNPKAILFHLGFLPTFFDLSVLRAVDVLLIIGIFLAVLGSSLTLYAYAAGKARLFFNDPLKIRILNRGAGTMLIGAGIAVAAKK